MDRADPLQQRGDLAGILAVAATQKASELSKKTGSFSGTGSLAIAPQVSLVAGTRLGRDRHTLLVAI